MAHPSLSLLFLIRSFLVVVVAVARDQALVAPITKNPSTNLYTITLNHDQSYVIDLTLPFSRLHCPKPFSHFHLTRRTISINRTDGHTPTRPATFTRLPFACSSRALPRTVTLSRAPLALPSLFRPEVGSRFALCLPSTRGAKGVALFGNGPFFLMSQFGLEVTRVLSHAPLLVRPGNAGHYVDLAAISIAGRRCEFLERMLEFDSLGHGGVRISTAVPYTTLRSHVYRYFVKQFAKATRHIPRAKKVSPFGLCLDTRNLGSTRVGLPVPRIDLEMVNGKNWTVFGSNSMKRVGDDVACLAFVDGGERAEQAVVIGSHQMEDNLVLFDLEKSTIGFSSSLLFYQTTCANFNFTYGS